MVDVLKAHVAPGVEELVVINEALVREVLGMESKSAHEEPIEEIAEVRLSFKRIWRIDNLSSFLNLRVLALDNNVIEEMGNFEALVNLEWLDLRCVIL